MYFDCKSSKWRTEMVEIYETRDEIASVHEIREKVTSCKYHTVPLF